MATGPAPVLATTSVAFENAPALPYDSSITFDGATCTSRESGMTCTDGLGHGFVLSMQEARAF